MKRLDTATIRAQIDALYAAYPEIKEDEDWRLDALEGQTDLHELLRELERQRRRADYDAEAIRTEIKDLRKLCQRRDNRVEVLRALMFSLLQWAELRKMPLGVATLTIKPGPPRVIIEDETIIPDEFFRIIREVDKIKIREALNSFRSVPGATLSNSPDHLMITGVKAQFAQQYDEDG